MLATSSACLGNFFELAIKVLGDLDEGCSCIFQLLIGKRESACCVGMVGVAGFDLSLQVVSLQLEAANSCLMLFCIPKVRANGGV